MNSNAMPHTLFSSGGRNFVHRIQCVKSCYSGVGILFREPYSIPPTEHHNSETWALPTKTSTRRCVMKMFVSSIWRTFGRCPKRNASGAKDPRGTGNRLNRVTEVRWSKKNLSNLPVSVLIGVPAHQIPLTAVCPTGDWHFELPEAVEEAMPCWRCERRHLSRF